MKILFIHQNMPGQYRYLARHFGRRSDVDVTFLTQRDDVNIQGVRRITYKPRRRANKETHHYLRLTENGVLNGQEVLRTLDALRQRGYRPDVIVGHPGWGEMLYVKEAFPDVPVLAFFEFYYHVKNSDVDFGGVEPGYDTRCRIRTKNLVNLLSLEMADAGISPTYFQYDKHPDEYKYKISVIFDGVDTEQCKPNPDARFDLPDGRVLTAQDEVMTYCARAYEEQRGFASMLRAVAEVQRRRPNAHVLIVGGDGNPYGNPKQAGQAYKDKLVEELQPDLERTHFLGNIPWGRLHTAFQVSSAHIYLTVPFVLSWSMMEAMACGCVVIGSRTAPVEEVLDDRVNGLLVDFHDHTAIADRIDEVLDHPDRMQAVRERARATILDHYDLNDCMNKQIALIERLVRGERPAPPQPLHKPGDPFFRQAGPSAQGGQGPPSASASPKQVSGRQSAG